MLNQLITERKLPTLPALPAARADILNLLAENEYGYTPAFEGVVSGFTESHEITYGGKALNERILLSFPTPSGTFSFRFRVLLPLDVKPAPVFLHISFHTEENKTVNDHRIVEHIPEEEILDHGYGIVSFCYEDVTSDSGRWDGLALAYPCGGESGWCKIGMWAFAASRVMDYLLTREDVEHTRISVSGWSRLGKTALWCAAQDERFSLAISTESGCSGAALQRGKGGESIRDITSRFPYWFCRKYASFAGCEEQLPFDQHFLLALISPRTVFVGSAEKDLWADPVSEFLCAKAASPAFEKRGVPGLITPDSLPEAECDLYEGRIGYLLRRGEHWLMRRDWLAHIRFRDLHHV